MSGRVIVVGSVNVDLVIRAARLPTPGETVTGGTFERHHGGKGGNQAVAAARLGRPTLFVGAVGEDAFAGEARAALAAEHVDVSRLIPIPGASTGVALILVDDRAENLIGVASGANADLEPEMVAEAIGRLGPLDGDVVLVCNEIPSDTVREALRVGRAAGAATVLNPAPAGGLDASILALADVMTPNRSELAILVEGLLGESIASSAPDPVAAAGRLLLALAPVVGDGPMPAIVVTLGPSGARIVRVVSDAPDAEPVGDGRTTVVAVPAPTVAAVDSTGAGDAFCGALAVALAERRSLEDACRRAVAAGALATTEVGAREGMPSAEVLRLFLGEPDPLPPVVAGGDAAAEDPADGRGESVQAATAQPGDAPTA
jgi:ribokinase